MKRVSQSVLAALGLWLCMPAIAGSQEVDEAAQDSATQRAIEEVSAAYERLAGLLDQGSDEAVGRVQGDIENIGDWEYRIVVIDAEDTEALEAELNALGDERWEAFWVEPSRGGLRVFLKRSSISYLSRVPLGTLMRMLSAGGQ